ncbi:MAG TPA: NHL repeat-containing protein [Ignavibacteriaceae bacterium]|jgi:hypothetical protein|nr:NHL repeat-containing protein [Ignavibacteriaceae bacterium]
MKKLLLLVVSTVVCIFPQNFMYEGTIGNFNSASAVSISPLGFIYVSDSGTDEVLKLDTLGNLLKNIGGYGWSTSQFDEPTDVFAAPLNIYTADKNNHRVQILDKDLNYISSVATRNNDIQETSFGYPVSCAVSNQGDLFILDSENNRVIKFDVLGKFSQNFGGFDAGIFALENPVKLSVSGAGNVFILDNHDILKIFDSFGNGMMNIKLENRFNDIDILFNYITLTSNDFILLAKIGNEKLEFHKLNLTGDYQSTEFISSVFYNNKLYVLTTSCLMIFVKE